MRTLAAVHPQDSQRSQVLLTFFKSGQVLPAEPLNREQNVVLKALFSLVHAREEEFSSIFVLQLTKLVNQFLEIGRERFRLLPRKVGSVLTTLGFSDRKRTNSGWTLQLSLRDAEKVHELVARYGIDGFEGFLMSRQEGACKLCRSTGLDKKGPNFQPGMPDSAIHAVSIELNGGSRNR